MSFPPTEDNLDRIAQLWAQDLSTNLIGQRMGVTKNTICGAVLRARRCGDTRFPERVQGWTQERVTVARPPRSTQKRRPAPRPQPKPLVASPPPHARPPRIFELRARECRYPVLSGTKRGDHRFCARPCETGSPYCAEHHALCNVTVYAARLASLARRAGRAG